MKTRIITIIIIVAFFSGIGFKLTDVKQNKKDEINMVLSDRSNVPVEVISAQQGTIGNEISYNGTFEPDRQVTIVSEAQGKVLEVISEQGDFVSEGQIIARVDNEVISLQLQTAEAAHRKALDDLRRYENLLPGEAITTQQLQEAKLAEINAKTTLQVLTRQLEDTFIKAPFSGTLTKRYIERGTFMAPGSPVADIVDTRSMKFNACFSASDAINIKQGQLVAIKTDLFPGIAYNGRIKSICIRPDESKRYQVQAIVQNSNENTILPGTDGILIATLTNNEKQSITIPSNCIVGSFVEPTVYVVEDSIARLRRVIISDMKNNRVSVSEGLNEGDQVVLSGQINLSDNTPVSILKAAELN
ncbi:MAG TPA: efflux RND transporter periplasmic adaptor subunit [Bacteroidales bacterium]|nr:efflux RND transporter periplasmic adaptor subunit [Bacteroidales bacterium]